MSPAPKDDIPKVYSLRNGFAYTKNPYLPQVGKDGNLLLKDFHHIEQMTSFNRSTNVTERIVHSKGAGARIKFTLTESLADITMAKPYQKVGSTYDGHMRISTVAGERGSADTVRDPRGFSFKFKTPYGVMDWVFNNTPIFFIRDGGTQFESFIKTQKRYPFNNLNHMYDSSMYWDYLTLNPESIHQMTYMFGDRGIPKYPYLNTYSGHTFKFINEEGKVTYAQIHVLNEDGTDNFIGEELEKVGPDDNQARLWDILEKEKKHPKWSCYIQTMTPQQALEFRYNVNDLTKIWPHKEFPLRKFGEIVITEHVKDYFLEVEQIAFSPANTCMDGIEPSNDPVLVARLFSYGDAQRFRLNHNYEQLPVNRPINLRCPVTGRMAEGVDHEAINFTRDGPSCHYNNTNYNYTSSFDRTIKYKESATSDKVSHEKYVGCPYRPATEEELKTEPKEDPIVAKVDADLGFLYGISELDFEQPRALYEKVYDDAQKKRFIENVVGHTSTISYPHIKTRVSQYFGLLNKDLGEQIAKGLGIAWEPVDLQEYVQKIGQAEYH
ncbi:hypothetical protein ACO0RG_002772 [Hanseniaspora osmophila]|uniref:Catalase T n=1 Tax=Hanseniaspora osmophila TaxID=56408 RepID=A0A1E5R860_9ASCO|nr:Catalase T [Hanseniaspora osmophila]